MEKQKERPEAPHPTDMEFSEGWERESLKKCLKRLLPLLLALLLLYTATSFFYSVYRGESWRPFAFMIPSARRQELPTVPSLAPELMFSILESGPAR